ncbi:MAG: SEC-C metal-binding domain-containing protein [Gammaproteobacteria bacterium]|nr:SEC-C metal-binding domain-containing protein [Gammaproteobacteria bacterium]
MQDDTGNDPLDFQRLLHDAIVRAVTDEDPDGFMDWFRDHLGDYQTESSDGAWLDAPFAAVLGRSIWNAMPLPGNGFKPRPLPEPGRNDPCFCGSGQKYKRCCADSPKLPLDPEQILTTVLDLTPPETLVRHIEGGRVPAQSLVELASMRVDRGELWNAVTSLEPLFTGGIRRTDEYYGAAMDLLCDVYNDLGHVRRKEALLERIVSTTTRSPLRSEAWQRIAVARLDAGDMDGAWEAFRQAQQDHPDAPGIGLLEIQLLMSRGRADEARERAGFWEKRRRRQGHDDNDRLVAFFGRVSRDPRGVMAEMGTRAAGGAGEGLIDWLQTVAERPLPDYRATRVPDAASDADQRSTFDHAGPESDEAPQQSLFLHAPAALADVEARWHEIFPLDKPFSIHEEPSRPDSPWDPGLEPQWTGFLVQHPEAFDSLDIIDDLATALAGHSQFGADWLDHSILAPLLHRAEAIVDHALRDRPAGRLAWVVTENRPALRSLARRVYMADRRGDSDAMARAAERLLALNPDDNHGFRNVVADHCLREGDDEGALAVTELYHDTANPECAWGRVLALYRLDRLDEAEAALAEAMQSLPAVAHHLTAKRVKKPTIRPDTVTVGGDDQAWLYREAMRDVWQATPGALDWVRLRQQL